jgi:hypothetical protein
MGGGGGGSGFITGAALWGFTLAGWNSTPPGTGDVDYQAGSAVGGPISGVGGYGRVVIRY